MDRQACLLTVIRHIESWLAQEDRQWLQAVAGELSAVEDRAELRWALGGVVSVLWACPGSRALIAAAFGYGLLLLALSVIAYKELATGHQAFVDGSAVLVSAYWTVWCAAVRRYSGGRAKALLSLCTGAFISVSLFATWPALRFPHDSYNPAIAWVVRGGPIWLLGVATVAFGLPRRLGSNR
jgi:hypothetical protein